MSNEPLRLTIEDTGKGVRFEGDNFKPGYRVWKSQAPDGAPFYLLTRSVFFDDVAPPPAAAPIDTYVLIKDIDGFNKLIEGLAV
jgi:hypothetical protein